MAMKLVIDGYNLLHFAGYGKVRPHTGQFQKARDRLFKRLKEGLTEEELSQTTIIFDAQYAEGSDRRAQTAHGMQVIFSPRGRQADDLIEDVLLGAEQPELITVVSSDQRMRIAARAARAKCIKSDTFLVELDERKDRQQYKDKSAMSAGETTQPQPKVSPVDWSLEFADIDVAEIERSVHQDEQKKPLDVTPLAPKEPSAKAGGAAKPAAKAKPANSLVPEDAQPLPPAPSTAKRRVVPGKPDVPNPLDVQTSSETNVDYAELSFWEQRVADLLKGDDTSGKSGK
ncbi:NYN domain-containing protein [Planctomicrobium sp. SH527]|uniref:NYN domain-containing protein n=1 Tax=Planctomicrobium sp. SH527 TaxID=3448123 RepID=UPI003F5BE856